jgi:hypothetical protein
MLRVSAAISLIIWLVPISALATTYYVAKTGSNTYSCTQAQSQTMAKQTIQAAVNCARIPGDTVIVKAGTYVESVTAGNSGLSGKPITLKANPGDTVTWTNVIRDPASFTGALNIYDRSYIRIEGFRFQGSRSAVTIHVLRTLGTKTTNPVQGIEIINNTFIDNGGEGSPAGDPTYMIFFSGVGRDDAYTGSTVNTITGSTLTNNWGPQIVLYATSDIYVAHNTGTGAKGSKSKWDNNLYIANYVMLTNDGNRRNLIAQNDFGHFDKSRTTNLEYAAIRGDSGASQNIIQNKI